MCRKPFALVLWTHNIINVVSSEGRSIFLDAVFGKEVSYSAEMQIIFLRMRQRILEDEALRCDLRLYYLKSL